MVLDHWVLDPRLIEYVIAMNYKSDYIQKGNNGGSCCRVQGRTHYWQSAAGIRTSERSMGDFRMNRFIASCVPACLLLLPLLAVADTNGPPRVSSGPATTLD